MTEIAYAGGIGVFIGLEREHSDIISAGTRRDEHPLGVRTFALIALLGWLSGYLTTYSVWIAPVALIVVGAMIAISFVRDAAHGLTTEVAAVMTFAIGVLVHFQRSLSVMLALVTTLLLIAKPWVQQIMPKVRRVDLTSTLQLAIVLAIVLPLLPDRSVDPWNALRPREIGWFVVLIAGISYVGYIASRFLGEERGAGITGIVGGLTSSTAVTASMAQRGRASAEMIIPGQMATFIANAMMFGRVVIITAVISVDVALGLAAPMVFMALVMLGGAAWKWRIMRVRTKASSVGSAQALSELKNPFALLPAITWGFVISLVLVVAALAQQYLGDRGVIAAAAISGLADVDAITLVLSRSAAAGSTELGVATVAVTIAVMSNTLVKAGIALFIGGRAFGVDVALLFAVASGLGVGIAIVF